MCWPHDPGLLSVFSFYFVFLIPDPAAAEGLLAVFDSGAEEERQSINEWLAERGVASIDAMRDLVMKGE